MRRTATVLTLIVITLVWTLPAGAAPTITVPLDPLSPPPPPLSAESWILYDETHDRELAARDADVPRPMASTTKIMTALIAYEAGDLDRMVTVSEEAASVVGSRVGLVAGEQVPLQELVTGLLVRSGNDAALAISEAVAGSVEAFVVRMNLRAAELGLTNTRFANPHGIDTPGHYSSARDLLILTREAMRIPELAEAVALTEHRFLPAPDGTERAAEATNLLLGRYPGLLGVKTGLTPRAGAVLVAAAERDGRRLYAVVMGSEGENGHFVDAAALLDHGYWELMPTAAVLGEAGLVLDDREPLLAAAETETVLHLAAAGLLGDVPNARSAPPVRPVLAAPETTAPSLPGLLEALGWLLPPWGGEDG